ncbi:HAD-IIIC family phosphatase [Nitrosopumilus sp.]|uniref:HAD-IIIC family phosphatase n=1 Tax=Nitrosopumilus sp. TaxID=2024843 RepID=UPI0034A00FF5
MISKEKLSYYINKSKSLKPSDFDKTTRVALLSSFTINGFEETLRVKSYEENIGCFTYVAGYNQYPQEILNKDSELYNFKPDITFLILDTRTILGDLFYSPYSISSDERKKIIDQKFLEITNLVDKFVSKSKSKIIVTNLHIPTYSPYGLYETKIEYGFHFMINDFNTKLNKNFMENNSVYIFDFNQFISKYGENDIFNIKQFLFGDIKIALDFIPSLVDEFLGYVIASLGLSKRCIVLDLDNTLWGGVIGEDGFNGIQLGSNPQGNAYVEFQKFLLALNQRGILLAINSKNNLEDALQVIDEHPDMVLRRDNFACMKINWNDKVSNMKEISKELNFGLDNFVFFDDDPVNRELMKSNLPQVYTIDLPKDPSQYSTILQNIKQFNIFQFTEEDSKRNQMYLDQQKRKEFEETITNLDDFLKQLNLKVSIKPADKFTIPRISQLTMKTNQFNLTTKRYKEEDIQKFSEDPNYFIGCAQVVDKFGDNGITSVYIINKENKKEWYLDTFLLSCRVMGREIEKAIFSYIISKANEEGVEKIRANYIPTQKNKPIENLLSNCGFEHDHDSWIITPKHGFKLPNYIVLIEE